MTPRHSSRWWEVLLDWIGVWLIVFTSSALSVFVITPSPLDTDEFRWFAVRAVIFSTMVTAFLGSWTWVRRRYSTVPQDVQVKLPSDYNGSTP